MTKILLVLLILLTELLSAETKKTAQSIFIGKSKIGYIQTIRKVNGDTVTTIVKEYTSIKRGKYGDKMPTITENNVKERTNGELLSFASIHNENTLKRTYCGTMTKNGILSIEEQSTLDSKHFEFTPGPNMLLYEGIRVHFESAIPTPGTTVTYTTFGFPLMELQKVTRTIGNKETVVTATGTEQLYRIEIRTESEHGTITTISFVDEFWHEKKCIQPIGAIQVITLECPFDSAASGISEYDVMSTSAIKAPPNCSGLQSSVFAKYLLTIPDNFELPSSDEQKIIHSKNNTIQLNVSKSFLPADVLYPLKEIPEDIQMYLQPSRYIECEDSLIKKMSKSAVRKTRRVKRAVNRIRRFVQYTITPSLSTTYATALETAKRYEGDCTEFALLTTALCRAADIPARVVTGIAYLPFSSNFYYHAWAQVFIEGKWYSVDAALRRFDPGHIALSFSTDGAPDLKINDCLGILEIKKVKVSNIVPVQ